MYYRAIRTVHEGRISYGIAAVSNDKEIMLFEDITDSFETIMKITMEFNRENLDPIHLEEVLETFLMELDF